MLKRLKKWDTAGFQFKLEWLLRCVNTIVTGEVLFSALENVDTPIFKNGLGGQWGRSESAWINRHRVGDERDELKK